MSARTAAQEGIQFPANAAHQRSTTSANKRIFAAALATCDAAGAAALKAETHWREQYPKHLAALTRAGIQSPQSALAIAQTGLAEAWSAMTFTRGGEELPFGAAMRRHNGPAFHTQEVRGRGGSAVKPWTLPYRGRARAGSELADRIDSWAGAGVIEPSHGVALKRVMAHPEWFDLSDRTVVLLGASAEAGPLSALLNWRANIVAVDLPRPALWKKLAARFDAGNARIFAPLARAPRTGEDWTALAGADLLTQTPEVAAWLAAMAAPLDIAAIAYLDGELHVRVSLAMDGVMARVAEAKPDTMFMFMATPTDVFAVHEDTAREVMRRFAERDAFTLAATAPLRALTGGKLLKPHIASLITADDGKHYGLVDCLVIEQGPNYALAKRMQQWRAVLARSQGQRVCLNVAPSTATHSVVKNKALKAGFAGAHHFGIEVFSPETTNALMAALWVHDLRAAESAANPRVPLSNPLELFMEQANHGGLWRVGYLPRSALPLAALLGLVSGR